MKGKTMYFVNFYAHRTYCHEKAVEPDFLCIFRLNDLSFY